jgi:hypothetical protein
VSKPKSNRGRKVKTRSNSPPTLRIPGAVEPVGNLDEAELAEFDRLCTVLRNRGVMDRVDLAAVSTLAKLGMAIEKAWETKPFAPRALGVLIGHARGIRRELGLSLQSSRVMTRTSPSDGDARAQWRAKLAGGES